MKQTIILANVVVALILAGVMALQAIADRKQVSESAYQNAENLTDALTEHTRQTLAALDLGIGTIAEAVPPIGSEDGAALRGIHELLKSRQDVSIATFAFFVLDAQGRVVATSRTATPDPVDLSDYPEFLIHRDSTYSGLFLGPPRRGRVGYAEGRWIINVSRRIENPNGSFAGVAAAALSLQYLLDFYNALRIGEHGTVALVSPEGILLVRSPFEENLVGRDLSETTLFREFVTDAESGRFAGIYSSDRVTRISAYKRLGYGQALVSVGLGRDEVLAAWNDRLIFQIAIGALAMALFSGASIVTGMYFARRREWEELRSERLKLLADESAALVKCPDIDSLLNHATEVARRVIGSHRAVTSLTKDGGFDWAIHAVSVSKKYKDWRSYNEKLDGLEIYRLVCETNRPILMTQAELEVHPAWKDFVSAGDRHPPLCGWLAVPIVSQTGSTLGLIQLSDKERGEFTENDLHEVAQLASITGVAIDNLQAREAREAALAETTAAKAEIETIFTSISDGVYALDRDWNFVYLNAEAERVLNRSKADLVGKSLWAEFPETKDTILHTEYLRARAENTSLSFDFFYPPLNRWFVIRAFPHDGGLTAYFHDITRHIETEERLRQSQKMDAVGQLTGGVAHDFNNLLTVIMGNAELLTERLAGDQELRPLAEMTRTAAERGAQLTSRLLAFSRRQPLDPKATDINKLVSGMDGLLRRTLGEHIEVEVVRGGGLWEALIDAPQLENAILNLCINARDAMPNGGRLTIEMANAHLDEAYAAQHADVAPGQYVMVAVSDTGTGMDAHILAHAFEPFFTTKEVGKGSGLGLSMVYGFVKQSTGHVKIYSERGQGTTIKLYLPRADSNADHPQPKTGNTAAPQGSEKILLVEDEDLVREHVSAQLKSLGYHVVSVRSGPEALEALKQISDFDLLFTDVVMPGGLNGPQLAEEARKLRPNLPVLFTSGYT